ncbi:MAG: hypothetical protein KAS30_05640 [Candidatus Diapherotrites archaeon]|nr:hypothetical protein [Candidatus Diapherotrites archaeon]
MAKEDNSDRGYVSGSIKLVSDIQKERIEKEKSQKMKKTLKNVAIILVAVLFLALISGVVYWFATDSPMLDIIEIPVTVDEPKIEENPICSSPECFLPAIKECTSRFRYSQVIEEENLSEQAMIYSKTSSGLCKVNLSVEINEKKFKGNCFFPDEFNLNEVKAEQSSMNLICKNRFNYFFSIENQV